MSKPVVDRLEAGFEGHLQVLRVSVWSPVGRALAARYGVLGVPTFLLFDSRGNLAYSSVGRVDDEKIKSAIEELR